MDPIEREVQTLGEAPHERGLGEAGHADDQAMPSSQKAGEQIVDHAPLSHDALRKFRPDGFGGPSDFGD